MFHTWSISFVFLAILWRDCISDGETHLSIINGTPVVITDVPFMAMYRPKGEGELPYLCGAVIVHEKFVLSAAHCYKTLIAEYRVTVGTDNAIKGGDDYDVEEFFIHPKFDNATFDNDVLVIKLKNELTFSDRVQKIEMAPADLDIPAGAMFDTMGFGFTRPADNTSFSEQLLKVTVPLFAQDDCKVVYSQLTSSMICAGGTDKDSCQGDSGGPLTYNNQVIGLVSHGKKDTCGKVGVPGVYTRISAVRDFIDKVITS